MGARFTVKQKLGEEIKKEQSGVRFTVKQRLNQNDPVVAANTEFNQMFNGSSMSERLQGFTKKVVEPRRQAAEAKKAQINKTVADTNRNFGRKFNGSADSNVMQGFKNYLNGNPIPHVNPSKGVVALEKDAEDYALKVTKGDGYEKYSLDELKNLVSEYKTKYEQSSNNAVQRTLNRIGGLGNAYEDEYKNAKKAYNNRLLAKNFVSCKTDLNFAEKSKFDKSVKNKEYRRLNEVYNNLHSELPKPNDDPFTNKYRNITSEEIGIYNFLFKSKGKSAAKEYLNALTDTLKLRSVEKENEVAAKLADKLPVFSSALSVASNLRSAGEQASNALKYLATGDMDVNRAQMITSTLRGKVMEKVDWEIGNWDAFDFIYSTAMSGIDSVAAATLIPVGGAAALTLGLSAAGSATNDILERGGTKEQAFWTGLAAGTFETLFEKISIGNFNALKETAPDTLKTVAKNIAKSMLVNASEETATEIANIAYDTIANADISQYGQMIDGFMENGDNEKEAKKKAAISLAYQVIEAGAGGALMGLGMGGAGSLIGYKGLKNSKTSSTYNSQLQNGTESDIISKRGDESYARTDEFRRLQAESKGLSDEEIQQYHSGREVDDEIRRRLSGTFRLELDSAGGKRFHSVRTLLNPKTGKQVNILENVDGGLFHDVFETARCYLENGELVDLHEVNTTDNGVGYNDCFNCLSEDGLSGFSITPDGDLISVFNLGTEKGFLKTVAPIVKEKAKTLDCYNSPKQPLMEMYSKIFGFKTVSVMDYNSDYDHDNIALNHGSPQVAFMVNTDSNVEVRHFNKYQYEEAIAYRDRFASENGKSALDSDTSRGYNDSRGDFNELSDEGAISGGNQERTEIDTRRESQNGRTRAESQGDFIQRAERLPSEASGGKRVLLKHGNAVLAYTEKSSDNTRGSIAAKLLKNVGVDAVYCAGDIETNQNGVTASHSEALTAPDGKVFVSSNAVLSPEHIAYHENVHVNDRLQTEYYADYESVICDNIMFNSDAYKSVSSQINDNQYSGKYDVENPENARVFIQEIAAYINEYVMTDPEFAETTFAEMFEDWEAVKQAANKFNTDTKADFSESVSFYGESVFNEPSAQKPKYDMIEDWLYATDGKKRLSEGQKKITDIGKSLGLTVEFDAVFVRDENGKRLTDKNGKPLRADGIADLKNKHIVIDYDNKRPIQFIFKHELTHFGELSSHYAAFTEAVERSKVFEKWLRDKTGKSDTAVRLKAKLLNEIADNRKRAGLKTSNTDAYSEMIADFVGDTLFTDNGSGLESIIKSTDAKRRGAVRQFIYDFINYIKKKLSGNKEISFEISRLEDSFTRILSDVSETADNQTEKFSIADRKITINMSEDERAELLNNTVIKLAEYDGKNDDLNGKNVLLLKSSYNSQAGKILKSLGEKFGVFKTYNNQNVSLDFDYSRSSLNESVHKQGDISTDFYDFAKMLYVFDEVVENAVPIEVHTDKYKGTSRENTNLKYDYVLLSAFRDDNYIVPVEFHLKEMRTDSGQDNKLYVSVTLGKIKMEDKVKVAVSDENHQTKDTNLSSTISIPDLISKVNPEYGDFYKYLPKSILSKQQNNSRNIAVNDENYRLKVMRGEDVTEMLAEKARGNGYSKDESWKMDHKAPNSQDGYSNSMDNIDKSYGSDGSIYSQRAVYYYGEGRAYDYKAISVIRSAKNNPEKMIKIYRAVPNNIEDTRVRNGDWVAIVKEYAIEHGGRVLDDDYRIIENTVPAKHLFSNGDSINEWGYDNGNANEVYKNSENNVKLLEVTYDDNGKIIPLSERFNDKSADIKYSIPNESGRDSIEFDSVADLVRKYDSGEITEDEYYSGMREEWQRAGEKYGTIPRGEKTDNDYGVPKRTSDDKNTERFIRTVLETGKLSEEAENQIGAEIMQGGFSYVPISDKASIEKADEAFNSGYAENRWNAVVESGIGAKYISKESVAIGERLLTEAIKNGDNAKIFKLSQELSDILTNAGQTVQAAKMLKKMTGTGRFLALKRQIDSMNANLIERYGDNVNTITLDENVAKMLVGSKTDIEIEKAYSEAMRDIAAQVPTTFYDKWNAWRYCAMLSNPRTHIRNIAGNAVFMPSVKLKNVIAVGMEKILVDNENRTKSAFIKKEYREFAANDVKSDFVKSLLSGQKYDERSEIAKYQRTFKNNVLEFISEKNGKLLEAEDTLFKNKHYINALGGFLQARGVDLKNVDESILTEARNYAVREAKKATFNDESAVASYISEITRIKSTDNFAVKALKIAGDGVIPFKRTPTNIIRRGVEYSPLGLGRTLTKGLYDVKKGKITLSEFTDSLAAGLAGSITVALGMLLGSLGYVTGGFGDDKEDRFKVLNGEQEYAVQVFGKSFTVDWAAPSSIPFFIGVETADALTQGGIEIADFTDAMWNALEPITSLSMLSGIESTISAAKYSDSSKTFSSIMENVVLNYAMQGLPSISGSIARTIDPTQRSWYTDKNSNVIDKFGQNAIDSVKSKIPGLTFTQIPKIDQWGRVKSRGNTAERFAENFILPGYYSKVGYDETNEELRRLVKKTGDAGVLPGAAPKSFEVNGKTKYLTAEEYVTYATERGSMAFEYVEEFISLSAYEKLTDEQRAEVIVNIYKYANAKAKAAVSDYDITKGFKKVYNYEKDGISPINYYIDKAIN